METEVIVRRVLGAYSSGDLPEALSLISPDIRYVIHGAVGPYDVDCRGITNFAAVLGEIKKDVDIDRFDIVHLLAVDHQAASQHRVVYVERRTGTRRVMYSAIFWTVEDGKVIEIQEHYDSALLSLARAPEA